MVLRQVAVVVVVVVTVEGGGGGGGRDGHDPINDAEATEMKQKRITDNAGQESGQLITGRARYHNSY